uniref:Uncharacterized protein n=1 Tax=Brassica oleracea var. oleracea TaxID=109376 RepID=A0A0D3DIN1_BRAOL
MNTIVAYLDKILVCNVYFDVHLDKLKCVLFVLGKDILIFDLNKYLSCTFDPDLLVFVLSIQEREVKLLRNESIDRAQQPEIWRSFVVQTGYLGDASDRGSIQNGYLNIQKNHLKSFTEEGVMNFPNRRFSSPSIREYQTSKGDSCSRKKWPEPKPILYEPKVLPQSTSCPNQKHCTMDLRTNPFEEGEYDVTQIEHRPARIMDTAQGGLVNQLDQTEVFMSDHASLAACDSPSDHSIHADQNFPLDRADQTVRTIPSDQPDRTARAVHCIDPRTPVMELSLEPRPRDGIDRPTSLLSQPFQHSKTYRQAWILELSKDLFHNSTQLGSADHLIVQSVRVNHPTGRVDHPDHVLILTPKKSRVSGGRETLLAEEKPSLRTIKANPYQKSLHQDVWSFGNKKQFASNGIGHYANKCQKKRPLVTFDNENVETEPEKEDPLLIFDGFTYEPMEGLDEEQFRGHQANQEESSSIQKTDRTQDLRTNLFEEEGNDVPRLTEPSLVRPDWSFGWNHVQTTEPTEPQPVFPNQLDILKPTVEPDLAWVVNNHTRARLPQPTRHSKTHGRTRLILGREEAEDGHAFSSGRPSGQSRKRPYLYPVHPYGSEGPSLTNLHGRLSL